MQAIIDDSEFLWTAARDFHKEFERQKWFVPVAENSASDALNDVSDFRKRVAAFSRCELQLLTSTKSTTSQMERSAEELRQTRAGISSQSN